MTLPSMCQHSIYRCKLNTKKSLPQVGPHALLGSEFQVHRGIQVGGGRNVFVSKQVPFTLEQVFGFGLLESMTWSGIAKEAGQDGRVV